MSKWVKRYVLPLLHRLCTRCLRQMSIEHDISQDYTFVFISLNFAVCVLNGHAFIAPRSEQH